MSIRGRFKSYFLKTLRGDVSAEQLMNLSKTKILPYNETLSWKPTHISIFATDRCNLSCDMCPTHTTKFPNRYNYRHLPTENFSLDLLRYVLDLYPAAIRLSIIGTGEPLLNTKLFDMIEEGAKRNLIVDTVSNGLVLGNYLEDIVTSELDRISISINGHTSWEFNRMSGNPEQYYSIILNNVKDLVKMRGKGNKFPRIGTSFIVDRYNYHYMSEMIVVAEELGVDEITFLHFLASPYENFSSEERCLYADDPKVVKKLSNLMSKKYRCDVTWPYLLERSEGKRRICRWPFSILQIDGDGNVGGCPTQILNMHENGKVFDEDPWNNEYFMDLRRRHLQGDLFGPCESCVECAGVEPS